MEFIHSRSFIHRDIKPSNFLMGIEEKENLVYVLDFGLARQYMDPVSKTHIPYRRCEKLVGTLNFISVGTHAGREQSRRDDMESLGHMLVYLAKGKLPWQNLKLNKQNKYKELMDMKRDISLNLLCESLPTEFVAYIAYCRKLEFAERPDYCYLQGLFREAMTAGNYTCDYKFDWMPGNEEFFSGSDLDDESFVDSSLEEELNHNNTEVDGALPVERNAKPEKAEASNRNSANERKEVFLSLSSMDSILSEQEDELNENKLPAAEPLNNSAGAEQQKASLKEHSGNSEAKLKEEEATGKNSLESSEQEGKERKVAEAGREEEKGSEVLRRQEDSKLEKRELPKSAAEIKNAVGKNYSPRQEASESEMSAASS